MGIAEIAELANCSKSAVSIALNGNPGVSDATRANILSIARKLGYVHRSIGAKSAIRSVRILACVEDAIVPPEFPSGSFLVELVEHVRQATGLAGYACIVSNVPINDYADELVRIEATAPSSGLLLLGTNLSAKQITDICSHRKNVVVIDAFDETLPVSCVTMNNRQGAMLAARRLVELGHREIGYVRSSARAMNFLSRELGFHEELRRNGLELAPPNLFDLPMSVPQAQSAFASILARSTQELPSAIFCENDYLAIGVIKALRAAEISVPGEISVIGFDNISEARIIDPELTTIHVAKDRIAKLAVERLIDVINIENEVPLKQLVDTSLIARGSDGPAGKGRG